MLKTASFRTISKSVWLLPAILVIVLCILTGLKISGSSVGMFDSFFYGSQHHDPHLLFGKPQAIRSDEWSVNTPLTVAQSRTDFGKINPNLGNGQDMSLITDSPYREWSLLFRPQNWSFLVLPLEQAFAFKWWFLGFSLLLSCYFFVLEYMPSRRTVAMLAGTTLLFSPFVQWWYQTITIAPLAYSLLILIVIRRLLAGSRNWWLVAALAYLFTAFALVLYPPFQIACALAVATVTFGMILKRRGNTDWHWSLLKRPAIAALGASAAVGTFIYTRWDSVQVILHTVYPGKRTVASGGYSISQMLSGFTDHRLSPLGPTGHYFSNQSEASNFIFLWPFLLIPTFLLWRNRKAHPHVLLLPLAAVTAALVILSARILLPFPSGFFKPLLLESAPHARTLIGLGLLGFLQLVFLTAIIKRPFSLPVRGGAAAITFLTQIFVGIHIHNLYPDYIHLRLVGMLALAMAAIIYLILAARPKSALVVFCALSIFSSYNIHPLYVGLGPLINTPLAVSLQSQSGDGQTWVVIDGGPFTNYLTANGVHSLAATYPYPQLRLWQTYDPSQSYTGVYNRYAHAVFSTVPLSAPFVLSGEDAFLVHYQPCVPKFHNITRLVSLEPLDDVCLRLTEKIDYPHQNFYFYRVSQ